MYNTINKIINALADLDTKYGVTAYVGAYPGDASSRHMVITPLVENTTTEADNKPLWMTAQVEVDLYMEEAGTCLLAGEEYAHALEDADFDVTSTEYSYIGEQDLHDFTILLNDSNFN